MLALIEQLALFARLMKTVCVESCLAPQRATMITVDRTGKILTQHHHIQGEPPWDLLAFLHAITPQALKRA
jgi:hypothetical protein